MPVVISGTNGVSGVDGTASNPSYEGTDSNTGIFFPAADTIAFAEGGTEVARFDSAGNFGIGTSSPGFKLDVNGTAGFAGVTAFNGGANTLKNTGELQWKDSGGTAQNVLFMFSDNNVYLSSPVTASSLIFRGVGFAERARITSGGDFIVGTGNAFNAQGSLMGPGYLFATRSAAIPVWINRLTNDGVLVEFAQDSAVEGTISVSGTTVSYNGGHLARWAQTADNTRIELLKGTVMSNLDQMAEWIDPETGEPQANEQLNCMKVSDVEGDVNVAGVFVNWDNDDDVFTNDMNVAMTGDMIIRIAQGVTVQRGDLLMSAGDGTAKPQSDDIIRSKTVAKVTSTHVTCTYADGSYCVPCVLMAC
jgi:hypothetical protein